MCLSTVYENQVDAGNVLMKNVSRIEIKEGKVVITDFLERQLEIEGKLLSMDLMENTAVIATC